MNGFSNSLFCTPDLGLIKFYLKQAVDKSSLKTLKGIDKSESQKLVYEFVVPAVEESIKHCSNVGNWKDEKDYVLIKIHGWFFMSWMTARLGITGEIFPPIGTAFYSEILRICQFQEYLIQCLCSVDETTAAVLIEDITSNAGDDKASLLLELVEQCLQQLGSSKEKLGRILSTRISHIMLQIAKNVKHQLVQVDILSKLNKKVNTLVQQLQNHHNYPSGNAFTEKINIIKFNERLSDVMDGIKATEATMKSPAKLASNSMKSVQVSAEESSQELAQAIRCLVSCINYIITIEWKSLFHWQLNGLGCEVLVGVKDTKCHGLLVSLFTASKSLQTLTVDKDLALREELQCMADVLEPYWQEHGTTEGKSCFQDVASGQLRGSENYCVADEIEMAYKTMEEKLQHALYQVNENLVGDELCFEWLLLKEELYVDERWLICVETHAKKFFSIKIMKMLLDVLSVFQEFEIVPGGVHENIYISLKKVILDLLTHLTLPEQKEVVLYNFDLTCLHGHSFFHHPDDKTSESFLENILTGTMNKLVKSHGFSKSIMDGIIQGCLVSPYLTLKELLTKASERAGYEKVICELLQVIPWLVGLGYKDEDKLLIQVLKYQLGSSHIFNKKQEGQFLKLIEALLQPYVRPDFGIKEVALVSASDVTKHVVIGLLTDDVISPSLPLHVLMKCLSCGLISMDQKSHCTDLDRDHVLQLLFVVLEIHEEIEHFWVDWRTESESLDYVTEDFDDVMLLDVWDQMDVTFKITEEHLVPFLTNDVSREPHRYYSYIPTLQDHLNKLDWISSLFVTPLLQTDVFKECTIQSPSSLANLLSSHFKVEPIQETESKSFWKIYFQSCANSNEVFGVLISKLQESHPRDSQVGFNDSDEIIQNAANLLPFTSQTQWQRILELMVEMMKCEYLKLDDKWKSYLMVLPNISNVVDNDLIKTSELLILLLRDMSKTEWGTSCIWIVTLKNYVSNMKKLSLEISTENKFEVTCHLLVHLAYAAFKIVPESFEERITIILLDLFNQGLLCISSKDADECVQYLQGIINMVSRNELRLAMVNTMDKMLSKNVSK